MPEKTDTKPHAMAAGGNDALAPQDATSQARRRLLRMGAYVPPAIVGMAIIGGTSRAFASGNSGHGNAYGHNSGHGHGHTVGSCMPSACQPCVDYDDEEGKDKDKYDEGHHQRNKYRCEVERAKKEYNDKKKKKHKNK